MKKKLVLHFLPHVCLILVMMVVSYSHSLAQSYSPSDPYRMLIRFDPGTDLTYINNYRSSLGATEMAISPVSQVRLWYIGNFSTAYANHGWSNINETTNGSKEKAGVNSVGLNFETVMPTFNGSFSAGPSWNPLGACSNFSILCNTATKSVRVAIMDTGIGYTGSGSNVTFCNEQLFAPFYSSDIGYDFVNHDDEPQDDQGHGTHISGIIAQMLSLSNASNVKLTSYKTHNHTGAGNLFNVIMAIDQAIMDGISIINMSFSYQAPPPSGKPEPLQQAINIAGEYGILVVAAAGNITGNTGGSGQGSPFFYPASFDCPNIISVASVNCNSQLSTFSAWGFENVDIAMLGENVFGPHFISGNLIAKSGTSQAAAIVTGIATQLATFQDVKDYSPLKCSILSGSEFKQPLAGLIATSGVANAPQALQIFQSGCVSPGTATGADFNLSAAPTLYVPQQINETINAYPNPFIDEVAVNFTGGQSGEIAEFTVYNAMGSLVYAEKSLVQDQGPVVFSWRPDQRSLSGIYFVKVQTAGKTFTQKVIRK